MWNKLTIRIKITIFTAAILSTLCACLTVISVLNTEVFYDPIVSVIGKKPINKNENENIISNNGTTRIDNIIDVDIAGELYIGSRNKFKTQSIISAIVIIIIGTGLSYFIAGKTLNPINTLADRIEEIDENNLNGQIILPPGGDEVARLTKSFNHMLEKLDKAFDNKKLFASNAAHELKTPLTNILTNIEVMQMEDNPNIKDYEEVIHITKDNIERLAALVQDLLRFNADFDGELCENIRTDRLFEKIIAELSNNISEKNISVTSSGNINIYGDKILLERAFFNIVQNAVKYNKENGGIIITAKDDTIIIEDTGIGIPEKNISQIFEPFYCVDKSRSRKLGGSGLGLSIAKQIFDKHNIKITVSSEINQGTKFFIDNPHT